MVNELKKVYLVCEGTDSGRFEEGFEVEHVCATKSLALKLVKKRTKEPGWEFYKDPMNSTLDRWEHAQSGFYVFIKEMPIES
jgi:hypothetical protein